MKRKIAGILISSAVVLLLVGALTTVAAADIDGCQPRNTISERLVSNLVGAHWTIDGYDVTYYFDSLVDRVPSGGVPGLIEYCVYPAPPIEPSEVTVATTAIGDDGSAWVDPKQFDSFSFKRPDGDPSNIPLDGASTEMGKGTWASEPPAGQVVVLHINDAAECDTLYGGNPGTCWVLPGNITPPSPVPPGISKDAVGLYDIAYDWTIDKAVAEPTVVKQLGGSHTFEYTVTVTHDDGTPSNVRVIGTIDVVNPNLGYIYIDGVTDELSDGTICPVINGGPQFLPFGDNYFEYSCDLDDELPLIELNNTATVTWPDQDIDGGHLAVGSNPATVGPISFAQDEVVDECVDVNDSYAGFLGTVCVGDDNPKSLNYSRIIPIPAHWCETYPNTATSTTNDTATEGSASASVRVCGPITGGLTMGYWQNKNGMTTILNMGNTAGVCNVVPVLRAYAPFQDLSAFASCQTVANYVQGVIKAATARGPTMNAMLKAQMLATALDVYVNPALGLADIDLTLINKPIGSAHFEVTSAAFGGAEHLMVWQLLAYAAGQSNVGGSMWYGNVKSMQELAKDTFDAINNNVAFPW